ncbi:MULTISPECIES: iron-containing alcohol dehydrogenase family protein [unclassified Nocardioides]|uniref:iron-containing alcohol dehydrogenase family protein n=1 Tax=unclassified Nocardioides TaxID=2615069 RepID=UPI0009F03DB4|nr:MULTISPECIES: iron-containing alcohol dehydrogenase [unclassified Nocardioides]GAW51834.1 Putative alcohol dehydrogenase [Nocardioides sp. PD653-B2]GAW53512.1 putative alcohol dehydrogenase [Nocardioides sp. PD653]
MTLSQTSVARRERDPLRATRFELPAVVISGVGVLDQLPDLLAARGVTRVMAVTDRGLREGPVRDAVVAQLDRAGVDYTVFSEVESDPTIEVVEQLADRMRAEGHDGVVAFGGGSAMDAAKAAAAAVTGTGSVRDLLGVDKVQVDPLPLIAIPTTSGTGSEVARFSVLTDSADGAKSSISSMRIMPQVALLDARLVTGLPAHLTASTGFDALGHAVESFGSVWSNPISEALALRAMTLIGRHLRAAVATPGDLVARAGMQAASTSALMASNSTRLGLAHGLAVPLGATHHVPHGVAVSMMLRPMAAFNQAADPQRDAEMAAALDPSAEDLAGAIGSLQRDTNMGARLRDFDVLPTDYDRVIELAQRSDNLLANPREATVEDLKDLLEDAR